MVGPLSLFGLLIFIIYLYTKTINLFNNRSTIMKDIKSQSQQQNDLKENLHIQNNTHELSIIDERVFFSILQKVGSYGNYQILTTVIWSIVGYLSGGIMIMTPYLFYQDPYVCAQNYPGQTCQQHVCSLDPSDRSSFIPTRSMITIGNNFGDYRCPDDKLALDSIQTLMYIGAVIGYIVLLLIGDHLGRKSLMIICLSTLVIGMTVTLFCMNLTMAGIGLCICAAGSCAAYNVCFMFLAETISDLYRQKLSVIIQLFYGIGVLSNALWFYAVGNWYLILALFYFLPSVLSLLAVIIIVKDTPICLVLKKSPEQAFRDFKSIAKLNKIQDYDLTQMDVAMIKSAYNQNLSKQQAKNHFNVIDLFRYKSLRLMTIVLIVVQLVIIFEFYAPALMMDKFRLSLFINGLVIGFSELIAYPICYFLITKSKRRHVAYACFALTFVCSIILLFLWDQDDQNPQISSSIGVIVLIFIFRFAISVQYTFFYIYFNELYPTQVRVLGTSLVSVMGGIIVTVSPEIIDYFLDRSYPIMILFAVFSGLSIFLSKLLPQTFQISPPDVIQQLRVQAIKDSYITDGTTKYHQESIQNNVKSQNPQSNLLETKKSRN